MKLLVIDDEKDILILIKRALSSDYEVATVHRPFEEIPENLADYDLLIMDVMMPGEDGYSLLIRIRDKTDAPIIFLSAKALEEDVIYGLSIGADDYIRKPFAIAELRARVAAHIRRDKRDHIACIKDGNISIYPDSRLVQVNGKELSLTKSEFDIAMLLVRNKGQVFSKEQIYEKIYGFDKDGDESAVTEHIKNLRKKLSDAGNVIETVWGIGYRWKKEA